MKKCTAHRGWSGKAPENTMAAINLALQDPNVNAIEIDVQLTKDKVPVLFHDFTLERTSNGSGVVGEHTYEELEKLDAGSWLSSDFTGEKIPTLEQALLAAKGKCLLNIEIKTAANLHPGIEQKVVELVQKHNMIGEIVITSFEHESLKRVKELEPDIKTGLIIWGKPVLIEEQLKETGAEILSMAYHYLTEDFVTEFINKGYTFFAWTVNDIEEVKYVLNLHNDIEIITNYPNRFSAVSERITIK